MAEKKKSREYKAPKIRRTHINSSYMLALTTSAIVAYSGVMSYMSYLMVNNLIIHQVPKNEWPTSDEMIVLYMLGGQLSLCLASSAFRPMSTLVFCGFETIIWSCGR
jgi:hypothetical protein